LAFEHPHNSVHNAIGGPDGDMADTDYAAFDPIFWFHHANVDRWIDVWQRAKNVLTVQDFLDNMDKYSFEPKLPNHPLHKTEIDAVFHPFGVTMRNVIGWRDVSYTHGSGIVQQFSNFEITDTKKTSNFLVKSRNRFTINPEAATLRIRKFNRSIPGSYTVNLFIGEVLERTLSMFNRKDPSKCEACGEDLLIDLIFNDIPVATEEYKIVVLLLNGRDVTEETLIGAFIELSFGIKE